MAGDNTNGGEEKVVMGEESFVHMPYWRYFRDGVLLHGWQNRVPQDPQPGPFKKRGEGPSLPQGRLVVSEFIFSLVEVKCMRRIYCRSMEIRSLIASTNF